MTRPIFFLLAALLGVLSLTLSAAAQMEDGDRGILPIDSEGLLEVGGITVDVEAESADQARYEGWKIAQRRGFAKLWARNKKRPIAEAPKLNDATLNTMVSAIVVEHEEIGPTRYKATLGVLFDRARAGSLVGQSNVGRRSPPMLLIPLTVTGGTATTIETRNPWQRAWAQFRTSESQIDYVRPSGLGVDPLLANAAVTRRPDRRWWRGVADYYQTANVLVAEVTLHRAYPGGPAQARFVARAGRERRMLGSFTMTAKDSDEIPAMMARAVTRMDAIYERAFRTGDLKGDPALIVRAAPKPVKEERVVEVPSTSYRVRLYAYGAPELRDGLDNLSAVPGVEGVSINNRSTGGVSDLEIRYRGTIDDLRRALYARGWHAAYDAGTLTMQRRGPPAEAPVTQIELPPPSPQGQ